MRIVIDSGILGCLCHPRKDEGFNQKLAEWLVKPGFVALVPEVIDYELRRKFIERVRYSKMEHERAGFQESIRKLDALIRTIGYSPLTTIIMKRAAEIWADARGKHQGTTPRARLDIDVILASQAEHEGAEVWTKNRDDFERLGAPVAQL